VWSSDGNYGGVEGAWGWLQREERMKRGRWEAWNSMPAGPVDHLDDGGGFEGAGRGETHQGGVKTRSKRRAGGVVPGSREGGGGHASRRHLAWAKAGVIEAAANQVGAAGGGVGSGWNKRRGKRCIRNVGEVEERAGKGIEGVTRTGGLGVADEDVGTAVVGEGRAEAIASGTVGSPGWAVAGGVMGDGKLARGVDGMAEEVDGGAEKASVGGEGGIRFPRGKMIKGEFGVGEKAVPLGRGEVDVGGGVDGDEVVFERANVPLGNTRTVVFWGNTLNERGGGERGSIGTG
jgi:hypothetical protein